jgi:hypothetical protein
MDLEQGHGIWRGFFWLRLGTASFFRRTQLQIAVDNLFDDSSSITGRGINFLFDAGDEPPFLPTAVVFGINYPWHVDFKSAVSFIYPAAACILTYCLVKRSDGWTFKLHEVWKVRVLLTVHHSTYISIVKPT